VLRGVRLGRFLCVMSRVHVVPVRRVGVMSSSFVRSCFVMFGSCSMMLGRQVVMIRRLAMVACRLFRHTGTSSTFGA
jgi:hypothetical protein